MALDCLTSDECKKLLQNIGCNKSLSKFTLEPFSKELRGFVAEPLLLTLELDTNEKLTYFVKSIKDAGGFCESIKDHKFFEKEIFVYNLFKKVHKLLPNVDTNVIPNMVYYNLEETLVLENLAIFGYKGPEIKLDRVHMLVLLESLAKFHTVSIAYEHFQSKQLGRKYQLKDDNADQFITFFTNDANLSGYNYTKEGELGGLAIIDLVYANDNKFKNIFKNFRQTFLSALNDDNDYTKVLSHGDLWAFNSLFKYENDVPVDCKLIDFQVTRYAPPAHDVAMCIYVCSNNKNLQKYTHDYYDHYYNCLKNELAKINIDVNTVLTLDEYNETLKLYMPVAKYIWLCYRQLTYGGDQLFELMKDKDAFNDIVSGNGRIDFVKHCYTNSEPYRIGINKVIADIRMALMLNIVTIEDCYKLIEKTIGSKEYDIIDINMIKLSKCGFLGEHYNLLIIINSLLGRKQLSYFVKTEPTTGLYKTFSSVTKADYKEMQFYRKIIKDYNNHNITTLQEVVPKCYLNSLKVLVMEDLKGYSTLSARDCMEPEIFKIGLTALAKFHASSIIYEEKIGVKLNQIYSEELVEAIYSTNKLSENLIEAGKKGLIESIKLFSNYNSNITSEEFTTMAISIVEQYRNLIKPSTKFRNTICHGDFWSGNIMFNQSTGKLVDFQFYRYCPPANDLMQFIYFATSRKTRSDHLQDFLDFYYNEFNNIVEHYGYNIKTILPYQEFLESCQNEKLFGVTQACTHFQNILISPEYMETFFADVEFCQKALFEDRTELVRTQSTQDPVYAARMSEGILELREICEKIASRN